MMNLNIQLTNPMDSSLSSAVAKDIVENQLLFNWEFYFVQIAVIFLSFAAVSFLTAYFKGRGSNLATKTDFDDLLNQLRKTTDATESIKQSISHEDWAMREYKIIRRSKLEELLYAIYDSREWIEKLRQTYFFAEQGTESTSPLYKVSIVGGLYFPELNNDIGAFNIAFLKYQSWLINSKAELAPYLPTTSPNYGAVLRPIAEKNEDFYWPLVEAMAIIETKARNIMKELIHENINI